MRVLFLAYLYKDLFMLRDVPVLLISFNRPEMTLKAIENIRIFKPTRIYFSVDGPREGNFEDIANVKMCQDLSKRIDWNCEVIDIFSELNYGSGEWPYRSINQVLKREEWVLIIEDDVRISPSFYEILKELLPKYQQTREVFAVCASNISDKAKITNPDDYFFTKYFSGWGWATWANKWQNYEFIIPKKSEVTFWLLLKENNYNPLVSMYFFINFKLIRRNKLQAWDYQINHMIFKNRLLNIKMVKNLSSNEGIGSSATHTKFMPHLKIADLETTTIKHPSKKILDKKWDRRWRKDRMRFLFKSFAKRMYGR